MWTQHDLLRLEKCHLIVIVVLHRVLSKQMDMAAKQTFLLTPLFYIGYTSKLQSVDMTKTYLDFFSKGGKS